MGLLNRRPNPFDPAEAMEHILSNLAPPYRVQDLLMAILNQIGEWIPSEGYYAYTGHPDDHHLTLRVTRAATGQATVGPNYAGLVLDSAIQPVQLEIPVPEDPWQIRVQDRMVECGFGPLALFRFKLAPRVRLIAQDFHTLTAWLKQLAPLLELLHYVERGEAAKPLNAVDGASDLAQFSLQIPRIVQFLADLGADVLQATDGYLAVWQNSPDTSVLWSVGQGTAMLAAWDPRLWYEKSRAWTYALWEAHVLPSLADLGFASWLVLPLSVQNSGGILIYGTTSPLSPTPSLGTALVRLSASLVAILNSQAAAHLVSESYLDTLLAATQLLDEADPYNKNHHRQVAQLTARLALQMGWDDSGVRAMELAGMLHDLGMVAMTLRLTHVQGSLAEQTREVIQQHPTIGADLLSGLPDSVLPTVVSRAVREHHERWDGMGYPQGLKANELSLEGQLLACAEQFVARISARSYRPGLSVPHALYDLQQLSGRQLNPDVVVQLLQLYQRAGVTPVRPTA